MKIVIFHIYVSLPEGSSMFSPFECPLRPWISPLRCCYESPRTIHRVCLTAQGVYPAKLRLPMFIITPVFFSVVHGSKPRMSSYWLVVWTWYFSIYWEGHNPNWRFVIFSRGVGIPPTRSSYVFPHPHDIHGSMAPTARHGLLQLHAEPKVLSLTMLQRRAGAGRSKNMGKTRENPKISWWKKCVL